MKNPLTPAGIEPVTFRFVAQRLNHCASTIPPVVMSEGKFDPVLNLTPHDVDLAESMYSSMYS